MTRARPLREEGSGGGSGVGEGEGRESKETSSLQEPSYNETWTLNWVRREERASVFGDEIY